MAMARSLTTRGEKVATESSFELEKNKRLESFLLKEVSINPDSKDFTK